MLGGVCLLGLLAGCAVSNEGAVDYRKAEIVPRSGGPGLDIAAVMPAAGPEGGVIQAQAARTGAPPVAPARLYRQALRGADPDALIEAGDSISIHLRSAFLKDCEAAIGHPLRGFRPNGEIAIVVKAFEFGQGEDFDFGPDAVRQGRLVFYSPDVEKGQLLNFNNLPVYGPITYQGNPIGIDVSVIEIDAEDAQIAALLGTLATIGAQAYPPAAPILPVLNSPGQALLNGGTNDTEMRFALMLDPGAGYAGVSHPTVEAGDYVCVKKEDRRGRHQYRPRLPGRATLQRRHLSHLPDQQEPQLDRHRPVAEHLRRFLGKLEQEDLQRAAELKPFLAELEQLGLARVQTRRFGEARGLLTEWQAGGSGSGGPGQARGLQAGHAPEAGDHRGERGSAQAGAVGGADRLFPRQAHRYGRCRQADRGRNLHPGRFAAIPFEELFAAVQGAATS
jgi:hypothetical protein